MKNAVSSVLNTNKTLVMSLVGISDAAKRESAYSTLSSLSQYKAPEFIADLSIVKQKRTESLWYKIINESESYAATIPCYSIANKSNAIDKDKLLDTIIEQVEEGVKMITLHLTPSKKLYELSRSRMTPCTSRGGNIILNHLLQCEFLHDNPYMAILPQIIECAKKHRAIISIGASFRSSNIFDSLDAAQLEEIKLQLKIARNIKKKGVEVILETPGHASPRNIEQLSNIFTAENFPLMPLGPIVTDTAIGLDHIAAAIGATMLGKNANVKILAAVTEEEHTGNVPSDDAIIRALKTAQLTAHIIDMYKYLDYGDDFEVAKNRADNRTCVYQLGYEGCSRCKELCPLTI